MAFFHVFKEFLDNNFFIIEKTNIDNVGDTRVKSKRYFFAHRSTHFIFSQHYVTFGQHSILSDESFQQW
mgnify:CR=1 FL=1